MKIKPGRAAILSEMCMYFGEDGRIHWDNGLLLDQAHLMTAKYALKGYKEL
jgi:hypothetical protein